MCAEWLLHQRRRRDVRDGDGSEMPWDPPPADTLRRVCEARVTLAGTGFLCAEIEGEPLSVQGKGCFFQLATSCRASRDSDPMRGCGSSSRQSALQTDVGGRPAQRLERKISKP